MTLANISVVLYAKFKVKPMSHDASLIWVKCLFSWYLFRYSFQAVAPRYAYFLILTQNTRA